MDLEPPEPGAEIATTPEVPAGPVNLSYARGAQVISGGSGTQINFFNVTSPTASDVQVWGSSEEFGADLHAFLIRLSADARLAHLPAYLAVGADVTKLARTVRLLGRVRGTHDRSEREDAASDFGKEESRSRIDGDPDRMYALPADRDSGAGEAPRPWEQVAGEYQRLMILGDPGMGKSWLIRSETYRLAHAALQTLSAGLEPEQVVVPVPIRADVLASLPGETLARAAATHLVTERLLHPRSANAFAELINTGQVILLIDALDEVPNPASGSDQMAPRKRLDDLLGKWVRDSAGAAACVVTSRLNGYSGSPIPGMREVELLPFSTDDVRVAMEAWQLPARASARITTHLQAPGVAEMARIPLLLALLCSLAADLPDQEPLPTTRTALYTSVTNRFLSNAHRTVDPGGQHPATKPGDRQVLLAVLGELALGFATSDSGWVDRMRQAEVLRQISAMEPLLQQLGLPPAAILNKVADEAGVLVPAGNPDRDEQPFMFLHRTFAEYFVARRLTESPSGQRLRLVRRHAWFDPAWAEVIPMVGGLLATTANTVAEARSLVAHFLTTRPDPLNRSLIMALRIVGEAPAPDDLLDASRRKRMTEAVAAAFRSGASSPSVARTIAQMPSWPTFLFPQLKELLASPKYQARHIIAALAGRGDVPVLQTVVDKLTDPNREVRDEVVRVLAGQDHPDLPKVFRDYANPVLHPLPVPIRASIGVRLSALEALLGRDDEFVIDTLLSSIDPTELGPDPRWIRPWFRPVAAAAKDPHDPDPGSWIVDPEHLPHDPRFIDLILLGWGTGHDAAITSYNDLIQRFVGLGHPRLLDLLLSRVGHAHQPLHVAALRALATSGSPQARAAVDTALRNADSRTCADVFLAMADSDIPAAVNAVLKWLADHETESDPRVLSSMILVLSQEKDPKIVAMLQRYAGDEDETTYTSAASALARFDDPGAVESLLANAHHYPTTLLLTLLSQAAAGHSELRTGLIEQLQDRATEDVVHDTDNDDGWVLSFLLTLSRSHDRDLRLAAVAALSEIDNPSVVDALLSQLREHRRKWSAASETAIDALATRRDPRILTVSCRPGRWMLWSRCRQERHELAERIVDQLYSAHSTWNRRLIRRRLGRLTQWSQTRWSANR
jgi:HEAT repeat protein